MWPIAFAGLWVIGFVPMYVWRIHTSVEAMDIFDWLAILVWPITVTVFLPARIVYLYLVKAKI
jgi:hypothetical protein